MSARDNWRNELIWSAGLTVSGLVLMAFLSFSGGEDERLMFVPDLLTLIGQLLAIRVVWLRGTFKLSLFSRIALGSLAVALIGALFKIQHWPTADAVLMVGLGSIAASYTAHYLRKSRKRWSDHLKALWVLVGISAAIIQVMHLSRYADELSLFVFVLFWCMVLAFAIEQRHRGFGEDPHTAV